MINLPNITENDIILISNKLKPKMSSGPDGIPTFFIKDCINVLAKPLCKIFNLSLKLCLYPTRWKLAKICPILKKGNKSDISNYRPVSLICGFSKLFEMLIYDYICPKIESRLSIEQHGFMRGQSTTTNLACFTQYTAQVLDNRGQVDVVFTDFSKAFDKISHSIILQKMHLFDFSKGLINFFKSYLNDRKQFVQYNGYRSIQFSAISGVPQGSNLGPMLFLIFINDITSVIDVKCQLFADDLKVYNTINSAEDCVKLQNNLVNIQSWCDVNDLSLNISKCSALSFTRKLNPIHYNYQINDITLNRPETVKDIDIPSSTKGYVLVIIMLQ